MNDKPPGFPAACGCVWTKDPNLKGATKLWSCLTRERVVPLPPLPCAEGGIPGCPCDTETGVARDLRHPSHRAPAPLPVRWYRPDDVTIARDSFGIPIAYGVPGKP